MANHRQHDDAGMRSASQHATQKRNRITAAVDAGHADVRHDDVAHAGVEEFGQTIGVGRFADDFDM
ncbi:hypothetical protein GGD41_005508 [Paraburkholderia bryophila]|uniref:Uncharacterized protein n=1 Tax=Paraburkholderia bryophila TaxID=420952 RepID=A0A7Y9WCH9_9BURK|nr:hypothetical protein [Paraburkholderia bryophila]